jgi:hypothetical protein
MRESRLVGDVRRTLVVGGAVFGIAMLIAGVAGAADPVQLKSGWAIGVSTPRVGTTSPTTALPM